MYESVMHVLDSIWAMVWGIPLLALMIGIGFYLTFALRGLQFRYLWFALKLAFGKNHDKESEGDISHFQSLMTALAASIGIGNIAGVATGIALGGFGALFWMWVTAIIGMATKYAEAILAVKYRVQDERQEMSGGPMYFIERALGWKWLAGSFALFGCFAAFGGGNMIQAHSVADVLHSIFQIDPLYSAIGMALLVAFTIMGGIKSIGSVASFLVPFMAIMYIGGASYILIQCFDRIPEAFMAILTSAFSGSAAIGGFAGSSVAMAIQVGVSRGLMTSEAGLGTASIASAAAKTKTPGHQALVSMTGCFLATILLCTVTGLVLHVTDVFGTVGENGKLLNGATLTVFAFNSIVSWGGYIVSLGLILFAFTTLIGWAYYGEKCAEYLLGQKSVTYFRAIFIVICFSGALMELEMVWKISDIFNGLMAFPNLIGVAALSGVVVKETKSFMKQLKQEEAVAKHQLAN